MTYVISKDSAKIAYDIFGVGKKLIFITGAICHRNFKPVLKDAKTLGTEYSVINYDRRGRGDSSDQATYSIEKELEDIEALINVSAEKVSLYGHSSGAVLALEAGLRFPNKIDKIVVYDPAYVHNQSEKSKYAMLRADVLQLLEKSRNAAALKCFLSGIGMPKFFVFLLPLFPGWGQLEKLAPTLAYDMELTKDLPPEERLSQLKVPLKVAYGEKSPESIRESSKMIANSVPGAVLHKVRGTDHMISGKQLLEILHGFL